MSKHGNKLSWPERADICWIPSENILCSLKVPVCSGRSARQYQLDPADLQKVEQAYTNYMNRDTDL